MPGIKLSGMFALITDFESCLAYFFCSFVYLHRFFSGLWLSNAVLLAQFTLPRYVQSRAAHTVAMYDNAKQPQKASVALFHTRVQSEPASYLDGLPDAAIHPSLQGCDDRARAECWSSTRHPWCPCQATKIINGSGDKQNMSFHVFFQDALLHEYLVFWAWVQRLLSSNSVSPCAVFHCKLPPLWHRAERHFPHLIF